MHQHHLSDLQDQEQNSTIQTEPWTFRDQALSLGRTTSVDCTNAHRATVQQQKYGNIKDTAVKHLILWKTSKLHRYNITQKQNKF